MAIVIESPQEYTGELETLFLAGGITGCPDWQSEMIEKLRGVNDLVVFNPRRANFPIHDPTAAKTQITWEYEHLRKAHNILFWFPCETLCPIVLYELGFQLGRFVTHPKKYVYDLPQLFIGVHPEYQRRQDVEIQAKLAGIDSPIAYSLDELAQNVVHYLTT